ncbi:hypothetical protein IWW37_005782 [Coemansia sp. RSA 2050]|nr:hypothetical protein IWW37_005782 [Coemansia sp. RSA 2050]KAJ2729291.1 hypothetical protein IW152_005680 [Coemansia sp. BCRC 34962]
MDFDNFESFIDQSLVDPNTTTTSVNLEPENELFLQLLLSSVTPASTGTIDPSALSADATSDEGAFRAVDDGSLLSAALFSAMDTMPPATVGDDAMLVDSPLPTASVKPVAKPKAKPQTLVTTAKPKQKVGGGKQVPKTAAKDRAPTVAPGMGSPGSDSNDSDVGDLDLKSLTSKERRQLRNKISARNFRVRRKEYISDLEDKVRMHKEEADGLRSELAVFRKDNSLLRDEVKRLSLRLGAMAGPATAAVGQVAPKRALPPQPSSTATQPPTQPQPQSQPLPLPVAGAKPLPPSVGTKPLPAASVKPVAVAAVPATRFNPHKDIGQAGPKKDGNWAAKNGRSGFIAVNTATVPADHAKRLESLVAEARGRRAVEELLSFGATARPSPVDPVPELTAEFVMLQVALESSFALAHASSHAVKVSC